MESRQEVKIVFSKVGELAYVSHRNLATLFERAVRRAEIPVAFSKGYNPRPRISFPSALETGISSECEYAFVRLGEPFDITLLQERLSRNLPTGVDVQKVEEAIPEMPRAARKMTYEVQLPEGTIKQEELDRVRMEAVVERKENGKTKRMELKDYVRNLKLDGKTLEIKISMTERGSVRPREVLKCLGIRDPIALHVRRTHVELC